MTSLYMSIKLYGKTFNTDTTFIPQLFEQYSPEQYEKYFSDLRYCEAQGWVEPFIASHAPEEILNEAGEVIAHAWGDNTTKFIFNVERNELTKVFSGDHLQEFIDYFITFRENFKPQTDFYRNNPSMGKTNTWIDRDPNDTREYTLPVSFLF